MRNAVPTGKLGMWVFLISEIMFFTALIGSYIVLRLGAAVWPNPRELLRTGLLAFNTGVLISSSLTMALSLDAIRHGNPQRLRRLLLLTALLGTTFLAIKLADYLHLWHRGLTLSSGLFGSCYYMLTGFHALHLLSGVVLLAYLFVAAGRGAFSSANYGRVECSGLYWHFVDAVWVILFAVLCLI